MFKCIKPFLLSRDGITSVEVKEAELLLIVPPDLVPGLVAEGYIEPATASSDGQQPSAGGEAPKDGQGVGSGAEAGQASAGEQKPAVAQAAQSGKKA